MDKDITRICIRITVSNLPSGVPQCFRATQTAAPHPEKLRMLLIT